VQATSEVNSSRPSRPRGRTTWPRRRA